jgi:hypothetical protein
MLLSAIVLSLAPVAAGAIVHATSVEHRGARYGVDYRPHVRIQMKTVGTVTGTRPTVQRCQWSMNVAVERSIRGVEGRPIAAALLPETRVLSGSRHGDCTSARQGIEAEQTAALDRVRAHVAQVAATDHAEALAALDDLGNRGRS